MWLMMEVVMSMEEVIEAVNIALEAGNWADVSRLTVDLYALAEAAGDTQLLELVQDMHWIANDALAHPLEAARVLVP
jgi:DNA-binding GntR family transcriptional regulator